MRKPWLIGTAVVVALGIATAVVVARGGAMLGLGGKGGRDAVAATLEFTASEVVQPAWQPMSTRIEFSGPLVAPGTAVVRAKASGTLESLAVQEGSRVQPGQLLGRIDLAELASRAAERAANLEAARAALAQAQRSHTSNERLAAQAFISSNALEASRAQLDSATAQAHAAQASLQVVNAGQREAALLAPIGGIVAKRHVVPGEKVSIEQALLTIVDLQRLELAGSVGTHEVSLLAPGMAVQVRVEGVATPVQGRLARIAPAAEAGTRSIGVAIALDNTPRCAPPPRATPATAVGARGTAASGACSEALRAGQYALARVELADAQQRLTLPVASIGGTGGQDHVWVIHEGALLRRVVTLGRRDAALGRVEVLNGLQAEAQVLAARFDNLREGAKAVIVADKAANNAAGPASSASATR